MSDKSLQKIIDNLTKKGLDATVLDDESSPCVVHSFLPTGCLVLDAIMGGGLPVGRVVEIYGDTSTGKSLIAAQACAVIQDSGGIALYIDTETAVSLPIMDAVGVNTSTLIYTAPDTVEEVFEAMETAIANKPDELPMLIVWDSVAATSAESEMKKSTGDVGYLTHARVISQGLRRMARHISKSQVSLLVLNQAKENIGVVYGDHVATFGGKAVGFHSSIRLMLSLGAKLKDKNKRALGIVAHAEVTKNKVAPPYRKADLHIMFGYGIDDEETALAFLKSNGIVKYSAGSYSIPFSCESFSGKFSKAEWPEIFDKHYDSISKLVMESVSGSDLV